MTNNKRTGVSDVAITSCGHCTLLYVQRAIARRRAEPDMMPRSTAVGDIAAVGGEPDDMPRHTHSCGMEFFCERCQQAKQRRDTMEFLVRELAAKKNRLVPVLHITHALIMLVLGLRELRVLHVGSVPDEWIRFTANYGIALLASALLSGGCAGRGLASTAAGGLCSTILVLFHTGAVMWMTYVLDFQAVALHVPFAAAFAIHAAAMSVPPDKEH